MKLNQVLILAFSVMLALACKKEGCTDQNASNYNPEAENDDGSCVYDGTGGSGGTVGTVENLSGTTSTPLTVENISTDPSVTEYIVDGHWNIESAVTIEPGVRIMMKSGARITVAANGSLNASGTASENIYFVGEQDVEGYWQYIRFYGSNNPNNALKHVVVKNAGSNSSWDGAVYLYQNSRLVLQNSNITKSASYGLLVYSADAKLIDFQNNFFDDCTAAPIKVNNLTQAASLDVNTDFVGNNGYNWVEVSGGNVNEDITVKNLQGPIYCTGAMDINNNVIILPGTEIRMAAGSDITVQSTGSLYAVGTASERIKFIGNNEVQGAFEFILFYNSNSAQNEFQYVDVSYGGANNSWDANIYLYQNTTFKMGNSSSNYSQTNGVTGSASATFVDLGGNTYTGNAGIDNSY